MNAPLSPANLLFSLLFATFVEKLLISHIKSLKNFLDNYLLIKMPFYSTKFNISWLENLDSDEIPVK
jgi:hypothetical protein